MKKISTPITEDIIKDLNVGDMLLLSGDIFCGRDSVLPKIVDNMDESMQKMLRGSVIFHTAVSRAGLGPTSSNKLEIESSIIPLSQYGVKIHLGKGRISDKTIEGLNAFNSIFAVIPPVTALLEKKTISKEAIVYSELGMEAFFKIKIEEYPIIVAAAHGRSIFDE